MSSWKRLVGQVIEGKYHLREVLGEGSFALVFRADEVVEGKVVGAVAVKLIYPDPEFPRERQAEELNATLKMAHPSIVRGISAGVCTVGEQTWLYLVMELAESTLEERMRTGPLTPREAWSMTQQVISALAYLHKDPDRLVHRDIKPANILRFGKTWKLADFGLAYAMERRVRKENQLCGTERYIPPEGFEGTVTPAWDIWSFGLMLAEALTGQHPFENEHHLFFAITQMEPSIPPDLPFPFMDIIRGCLIKKRSTRWTAPQVLTALQFARGARAYFAALRWTLLRPARNWFLARSKHEAQEAEAQGNGNGNGAQQGAQRGKPI